MIKPKMTMLVIILELIVILYLLLLFFQETPFTGQFTLTVSNTTLENELPIYWPVSLIIPSNNSKLRFELRPNYTIKFDGYNVQLPKISTISINSDGFRDKEYPLEKSKNTFRIIILGDSVTFGFGVENNESYPKILEAKLNTLNNGINYEVLNFGVWGYGTIQEVETLKIKGVKYKPDMVILGYHGTDLVDNFNVLYGDKFIQKIFSKYNISDTSNLPKKNTLE
jgi:hypothetical protein